MGSIIKKKIKNNIYYYFVESARVNGKPRIVSQVYLGTAQAVFDKLNDLTKQKQPLYSEISDFADVMLLYDIATRLDIIAIINKHATKRSQGITVGEYALIAALNRVIAPASKSCIASWYSGTVLPQILLINESALSPQNYWNHMRIADDTLNAIDEEMVVKIINTYNIDTSHLIYDATNFYTFIDTKQPSELAKRGRSKEKRNDLKIVGLSMMITPDCNIPLLYDTYPGNNPDSKQFTVMVNKLKTRFERLTSRPTDITVIFDRGNNSADNIIDLESEPLPLHYVGGLKRSQCADLYEVPNEHFIPLEGKCFNASTAYRTSRNVFDREMTIVVVFNPSLFAGQMQGVMDNIEKTMGKLSELQSRLRDRAEGRITKGRAPTTASVEKQVKGFLGTEFMNDIFDCEMTTLNGIPYFNFSLSSIKFNRLQETILGKTVLFTNRHNWTNEEIASSYRSAWHIEHAFRQMKDADHLTVRPLFHWTDQKIKIHIFYCVLAYRLCCILMKELQSEGISNYSLNRILDQMSDIKFVTTVLGTSQSDILTSFSKGTNLAESITSSYDLKAKYLQLMSVR